MSVVILGGNECMVRKYKDLCRSYQCSAKVISKMGGTLKNRLGNPDLLVMFTDTISHKMVQNALNEHRDALLGEGLRAGCADAPADLTAKGQADALTDLIGFHFAAADAGVKGIALRAGGFRRRNARRLCRRKQAGDKLRKIQFHVSLTFRRLSDCLRGWSADRRWSARCRSANRTCPDPWSYVCRRGQSA